MSFNLETMETALPGLVVGVNSDGTVDCRCCIRKVLDNGAFDTSNVALKKIPLMKLGGANAEFSFTSKKGDQVLLVAFSRDSSKWKKNVGTESSDDTIPDSSTGLTMNDFVAVPFISSKNECKAQIKVTEDGDILFSPATGRSVWCDSDFIVKGNIKAYMEISAFCNAQNTMLSTHTHGSAVGPTTQPVPTPTPVNEIVIDTPFGEISVEE